MAPGVLSFWSSFNLEGLKSSLDEKVGAGLPPHMA